MENSSEMSSVGHEVATVEEAQPHQGHKEEEERTIRERAAKVVGLLLQEETTEEEGKEAIKQYIDRKEKGEGVEKVRMMVEDGDLYRDVIEGRTQNPFSMEINLKMRMRRMYSSVWSENPTPRWKKEKGASTATGSRRERVGKTLLPPEDDPPERENRDSQRGRSGRREEDPPSNTATPTGGKP